MSDQDTEKTSDRARKTIRLHSDTLERVRYWSSKRNMNENDYLALAVEEKIARENGDYELPTLEQQRLNQLIDEVRALSTNNANLERVILTGFESLLGLTRGDSYLGDEEDGELGIPDTASAAVGA